MNGVMTTRRLPRVVERCGDLAELAAAAELAWQEVGPVEGPEAPDRRRWLRSVHALLHVEAALEREDCACARCRRTRSLAMALRGWMTPVAEQSGLPLPAAGEEIRLPVNVAALEARARQLVVQRAVLPRGRRVYVVLGGRGPYRVHAGRPRYWETDWTCTCPWSLPYPPDWRRGRGCTHVRAVRQYLNAPRSTAPAQAEAPLGEPALLAAG